VSASALLPLFAFAKYPLALAGAVLFFVVSSHSALSLISVHAGRMVQPVGVRGDFNLPPVQQIGELTPIAVEPVKPINDGAGSMGIALAQTMQVALAPDGPAGKLRPGRIGRDAVNVRAAASKSSAKIGVLQAGVAVMMGRTDRGWVEVQFEGGAGWVYSSYLASGGAVEVTVDYGTTSMAAITLDGGGAD
jgi:uncharacterized protein YgiM (DUF1202 family)